MKKLFPFIIFLSLFYVHAQEANQFSLADCIQYAEKHNFSLQNADYAKDISEINYKQSKLNMAPTVSASLSQSFGYSHGNTNGGFDMNGNYSLGANVTLFNGLNIYNSIKKSALNLSQSDLEKENSKNQIVISILQSYLSILMNQELLEYRIKVAETSKEQLIEGENQYKVGEILESDYLLLRSQFVSDSLNIATTRISIENNYLTLKNVLGMSPSEKLVIITPESSQLDQYFNIPELNTIISMAFNYLPELKMANNDISIAEYNVKIAQSSFYPSLSANASVGTGYLYGRGSFGSQLGNGLNENIGLSLSIPIYNRYSTRNNVRISKIQVEQAKLSLKETELTVVNEIEEYYLNLNSAFCDYSVSLIKKDAYQSNYIAYNQKFNYGTITTADLLQQQNNYLNTLYTYMQNKYSFLLQRKILDVYMGLPILL